VKTSTADVVAADRIPARTSPVLIEAVLIDPATIAPLPVAARAFRRRILFPSRRLVHRGRMSILVTKNLTTMMSHRLFLLSVLHARRKRQTSRQLVLNAGQRND
jgi:hypothetical protein